MEQNQPRSSEAGFTLIEALTAIVVLVFGLMAITNLMLVAASSNAVASQATAATNSASRILDIARATNFTGLVAGGDLNAVNDASVPLCPVADIADYRCREELPGVGTIFTRWAISVVPNTANRTLFIQVRSEGTGAMSAGRSRAEFTTLRSCTDTQAGCPQP